jgi:hypothetical protein
MKRLALVLTLLFAGILTQVNMTLASSESKQAGDRTFKELFNSYAENLDIAKEQEDSCSARVQAELDCLSGKLINIQLKEPSTNPQTNADVIDAVVTTPPVVIPDSLRCDGPGPQLEFSVGKKFTKDALFKKRFRRTLSEREDAISFHSIPLVVLQKYPGVFTYEELTNAVNMRYLPNSKATVEEIQILRNPWLDFIAKHKKADKSSLLKLQKKVDSQSKNIWLSTKN